MSKSLIITFLIKGRETNVLKYLKLLDKFNNSNDILIICDPSAKKIKNKFKKNYKVIYLKNKKKIFGMNDLFSAIHNAKSIVSKYVNCCYVDDDNFIFPKAIENCSNFLNNNRDYIGCQGHAFVYNKKKQKYLSNYNLSSFEGENLITRIQNYNKESSLVFYALIRTKVMIKICGNIKKIKDDNLSEVLFNYLSVVIGKVKKINVLYLAREYPRPKIYNIPSKFNWLKNSNLSSEIICCNNLIFKATNKKRSKSKLSPEELFESTIGYYLSIRLRVKNNNRSIFKKIIKKIESIIGYKKVKLINI